MSTSSHTYGALITTGWGSKGLTPFFVRRNILESPEDYEPEDVIIAQKPIDEFYELFLNSLHLPQPVENVLSEVFYDSDQLELWTALQCCGGITGNLVMPIDGETVDLDGEYVYILPCKNQPELLKAAYSSYEEIYAEFAETLARWGVEVPKDLPWENYFCDLCGTYLDEA